LLAPSEEVTKTWVKRKGILIKSRPEPSRFSFAVCLAIVFSIAFGFLGGFITAGFTLKENFSSVYENLIAELENTRRCIEREKQKLIYLNQLNSFNQHSPGKNFDEEQPIFSICTQSEPFDGKETKNITGLANYNEENVIEPKYLLCKNCN